MPTVKCEIEEISLDGDYSDDIPGITATCSKCGHTTESFGTEEGSIKRCLALMREECPRGENNYYIEDPASNAW